MDRATLFRAKLTISLCPPRTRNVGYNHILGWFRGLKVPRGHRQNNRSIEHIDFLFDFNRNHASIFYHFRVIANYLSKVTSFNPLHLHLSLSRSNFAVIFGVRKLESLDIMWHYLRHPMFSHFDTIPECDRHTHRNTTTAYTTLA